MKARGSIAKWTAGIVLAAAVAAPALPVVQWNSVGMNYNVLPRNEVYFNFYTQQAFGNRIGISGWGLRDAEQQWTTLEANALAVGMTYRFFETDYGAAIDWVHAEAAAAFADSLTGESNGLYFDVGQTIYLGFRLGNNTQFPYAEYGWAQLYFDGDRVSILSSATERTGLGIVAGTGQAIPEPATTGLLLLGAAALAGRRRKG